MKGPKETAKHRLIVEGRDDKWSIVALTARHGWNWDHPSVDTPYIHDAEGYTNALAYLPVAAKTYSRLGVVLDADLSAANRWESLKSAVAPHFVLPEQPIPGGTIVRSGDQHQQFGAWLMPDNASPGMLEHFLAFLVPKADPCWEFAGQTATDAMGLGASFKTDHHAKAHVHTWLAWQDEPGKPFGTAITSTTFNHDSPEALGFVEWMRRLFLEDLQA